MHMQASEVYVWQTGITANSKTMTAAIARAASVVPSWGRDAIRFAFQRQCDCDHNPMRKLDCWVGSRWLLQFHSFWREKHQFSMTVGWWMGCIASAVVFCLLPRNNYYWVLQGVDTPVKHIVAQPPPGLIQLSSLKTRTSSTTTTPSFISRNINGLHAKKVVSVKVTLINGLWLPDLQNVWTKKAAADEMLWWWWLP